MINNKNQNQAENLHSNPSIAIINHKNYAEKSVFHPENLLREARRQKEIVQGDIPSICILDPDGDLVDYLKVKGQVKKSSVWACYHSDLYVFELDNQAIGVIPCVVGAPYAVLVAEQLFVSGCKLLISVTSSGIINQPSSDKHFALITQTIRDEGTSYHYLPANKPSNISPEFLKQLSAKQTNHSSLWFDAKSWTTDAPYRETQSAINAMQKDNITCVEMEAAALYAFATAKNKPIICFAHLTNTMAQQEGDFEKGEHFGSIEMLELIRCVLTKLD